VSPHIYRTFDTIYRIDANLSNLSNSHEISGYCLLKYNYKYNLVHG